MEFPSIFLGANPRKFPSFYSLINYTNLVQGIWYPEGGFNSVVNGFYKLALELGAKFNFNSIVSKIETKGDEATAIWVNNERIEFDIILGTADYHHIEKDLLENDSKSYSDNYWAKKKTDTIRTNLFYRIK